MEIHNVFMGLESIDGELMIPLSGLIEPSHLQHKRLAIQVDMGIHLFTLISFFLNFFFNCNSSHMGSQSQSIFKKAIY